MSLGQGRSHGCARVCRCHPQWQPGTPKKQMQNNYFFNRNNMGSAKEGLADALAPPRKDQSTAIAPIRNEIN